MSDYMVATGAFNSWSSMRNFPKYSWSRWRKLLFEKLDIANVVERGSVARSRGVYPSKQIVVIF